MATGAKGAITILNLQPPLTPKPVKHRVHDRSTLLLVESKLNNPLVSDQSHSHLARAGDPGQGDLNCIGSVGWVVSDCVYRGAELAAGMVVGAQEVGGPLTVY